MLMGKMGLGNQVLSGLLTGFKQEESGRILFLGKDLKGMVEGQTSKTGFFISRLGILFQDVDSQLFNSTVYDEIAFGTSSC